MVAGAVNTGVSGFVFAVPFAIAYLFLIRKLGKKKIIQFVLPLFLVLVVLNWNHPTNRIIFPYIGDEFKADCGWEFIKHDEEYQGYDFYILERSEKELSPEHIIFRQKIDCESQWVLNSVEISHQDLGTSFSPVFSINGTKGIIPNYKLDGALKDNYLQHENIHKPNDFQSPWTFYLSFLMAWPFLPLILTSI